MIVLAAGSRGIWAAALLLLTPRSLLVIEAAWIDPIVILMLAFTLYCAVRKPRMLWLALGMFLASKQYVVLLTPLMVLLLKGEKRRILFKAMMVAAAVTLPFFLWNPSAFVQNVITLQFRLPFRMDALSFTSMFAHLTGYQIGAWAGFVAAGAATFYAMRRSPHNPGGFAGAAAIVLLVFFALNKQAFCNYYFLVIACCSFAMALSHNEDMSTEVDTPVTSRAWTECPSPSPDGAEASAASFPPTT